MDQATENSLAIMMFFGIIGMLLLAVAVILFFVIYQRRLIAQQENIIKMELAHQRLYLEAVIQAQEVERKRIAQDLHDGVGALLSATKLYVNRLPADDELYKDIVFIKKETVGLLDETIDNIRSISRNLLPTSLERFGVVAAVEDLARRINDAGRLEVNFYNNKSLRFEVEQEFGLYRIVQELFNNSLKYAESSQIEVSIQILGRELCMTYKDNGKGFDLEEWQKNLGLQKGFGIRGIQSRADVLGASLKLESKAKEGFFLKLMMEIKFGNND